MLRQAYRKRPVEDVLRDVETLRLVRRRPFIEFADDNTFVNHTWSKQLLAHLATRDVRYFAETDVSVAYDDELLDLLYPSGCRQVLIGFESPRRESFTGEGLLEGPQYTRPPEFRGVRVPEVLLSGDHARIEAWREQQARARTVERRPDLLEKHLTKSAT